MEKTKIIPFWTWFWVTALGFIIGVSVTTALVMIMQDASPSLKANGVVGFGLGIGIPQYFILKKKHNVGAMWIWAGIVSIVIACWVFDQLENIFSWEFEDENILFEFKMLVGFTAMGIGQALLLKRKGYKDWYIFALSNLVPFLALVSTIMVVEAFSIFYVLGNEVFSVIGNAIMAISYTLFNAFAFKYIQEQYTVEEQTHRVEYDSDFHERNDEELNSTKHIERIPFARWFRATSGGFLIGTFVVIATERYAQLLHLTLSEISMIVLPIFVAYMQYRALSNAHNMGKQWIWAGITSFLISSLIVQIFDLLLPHSPTSGSFLVMLQKFVISFTLGAYHAGILKKLNYTHTYLYPIGYSIAFIISILFVPDLSHISKYYELPVAFMNLPSFVIVMCSYAVCTSLAFSYIQKQTFKDVVLPEDKWDKWRRELNEKEEN